MPVEFSEDEQFLINQMAKTPEQMQDLDRVASLLVKNLGNQNFSDRLYAKLHSDEVLGHKSAEAMEFLERYTYKTPNAKETKSIANKIRFGNELKKQGVDLLEHEKPTAKEAKEISRFSLLLGKKDDFKDADSESAKDLFKGTLKTIYSICNNSEFKELYRNMNVAEEMAAEIRENVLKNNIYKAGDLIIRNTKKSDVIENIGQKGGVHLDSIPQEDTKIVFFSDFDFLDHNYPGNKITSKSGPSEADISKINTTDIMSSDVYRMPEHLAQDQNFINRVINEKDETKRESMLKDAGAVKIPNTYLEANIRSEDLGKSKINNSLEEVLAESLEKLLATSKNKDEFTELAQKRVSAYQAVAGVTGKNEGHKQELEKLYDAKNQKGFLVKVEEFISGALVKLGVREENNKIQNVIRTASGQKAVGPITAKLLASKYNTAQNKSRAGKAH